MNYLHNIYSQTPSGIISKLGTQEFISLDRNEEINNSASDFLFNLIIKGVRNYSGNLTYETHKLTWELKTGDINLSLTDSIKNEFIKKLQDINVNATVLVKNHSDKLDIWIVFKNVTPLEIDLKVNRIFRQLEKNHSHINMSLFMSSEDELNGNDITSF